MSMLFVYGSLMTGMGNHRVLSGAHFVCASETDAKYTLIDMGSFPAMIPGSTVVRGELYEVNLGTLAHCDRLEGHPHFYARQNVLVSLRTPIGISSVFAWSYLLSQQSRTDAHGRAIITGGDWRAHLGHDEYDYRLDVS